MRGVAVPSMGGKGCGGLGVWVWVVVVEVGMDSV